MRNILLILLVCCCLACRPSGIMPVSGTAIILPGGPLTLVFSGDVMQHLPQVEAARQSDGSYDYTTCFQYIAPFWQAADIAVVNLETTLAEEGARYSGYPMFSSPKALAGALKVVGIDVLALANNHCCDRGARGVLTTLRTIDSLGLFRMGVYADTIESAKSLIINKKDYRIAFLNATYGTNGMPVPSGMVVNSLDTTQLKNQFITARSNGATHIIVFLHWGEEYQRQPNAEQRKLASWCRSRGADLVVGGHPHVVQPIDTAAGIIYSLGNFVSNQRGRYQDGGISVRVTLSAGRPLIEYLPHWVSLSSKTGYQVLPAYASAEEIGPDSVLFSRSIADSRRIVGAAREVRK